MSEVDTPTEVGLGDEQQGASADSLYFESGQQMRMARFASARESARAPGKSDEEQHSPRFTSASETVGDGPKDEFVMDQEVQTRGQSNMSEVDEQYFGGLRGMSIEEQYVPQFTSASEMGRDYPKDKFVSDPEVHTHRESDMCEVDEQYFGNLQGKSVEEQYVPQFTSASKMGRDDPKDKIIRNPEDHTRRESDMCEVDEQYFGNLRGKSVEEQYLPQFTNASETGGDDPKDQFVSDPEVRAHRDSDMSEVDEQYFGNLRGKSVQEQSLPQFTSASKTGGDDPKDKLASDPEVHAHRDPYMSEVDEQYFGGLRGQSAVKKKEVTETTERPHEPPRTTTTIPSDDTKAMSEQT